MAQADARRLLADPALARVKVTWASPGDSVRIIKVLDAVEPRAKGKGGDGIFPGFLGDREQTGRGETHRLDGVAVVAAGFLPRAQEAVIEMTGEGQRLSVFGGLHNLVVEFEPAAGASWENVDAAVRIGVLRLAAFLAAAAREARTDDVQVWEALQGVKGTNKLPRIGAITNLQTQGTFKDVFVFGRSFAGAAPTVIEPNAIVDGAVVSGQFGHPSLKNPTYMHQNHPVVKELRARDDLQFAGVMLVPEPVQAEEKERVSVAAATLCQAQGWDGAVITKEGGGNADGDISLKMDALHDLGIASVGLFAEMAGAQGTAPSLVVPPEKATALISTGNYDEMLRLPQVQKALGGETIDLVSRPATEAVELPTAVIYCSLSPIGAGRVTCASSTT